MENYQFIYWTLEHGTGQETIQQQVQPAKDGDSTSRFKTRKEKLTSTLLLTCIWAHSPQLAQWALLVHVRVYCLPCCRWALFQCYVIASNTLHGGELALVCYLVFLYWERTSMFKGRTGSWSDKRNRNQPPYPETRICRSAGNVWKNEMTTTLKALGHKIDLMTEILYSMVLSRFTFMIFFP